MLPFIELQFIQLLGQSSVPRKHYDKWLTVFDKLSPTQRLQLIQLFEHQPEVIHHFLDIVLKKADALQKKVKDFHEIIADEMRVFLY